MIKIRWLSRNTLVTPYLTLCLTEKEFLAVNKHLGEKSVPLWLPKNCGAVTHTYESNKDLTCIICLDRNEALKRDLHEVCGLLAHEATHVWQNLCESIGEKEPSREFEAYSIQMISQRLIEEYLRRTKHGTQKATGNRQDRRGLGKKGNKRKA